MPIQLFVMLFTAMVSIRLIVKSCRKSGPTSLDIIDIVIGSISALMWIGGTFTVISKI